MSRRAAADHHCHSHPVGPRITCRLSHSLGLDMETQIREPGATKSARAGRVFISCGGASGLIPAPTLPRSTRTTASAAAAVQAAREGCRPRSQARSATQATAEPALSHLVAA